MSESPYGYPDQPLPVRIVCAVADCEPGEIDRTDGDYEEVVGLLAEHDYANLLAIADVMGLEGDWGTDDVEEAVTEALHEYRRFRENAVPEAAADLRRGSLVTRLRTVIEWVSKRDHGRAVELDTVVHGLEQLAEQRAGRS